jgi:hypothetical protein
VVGHNNHFEEFRGNHCDHLELSCLQVESPGSGKGAPWQAPLPTTLAGRALEDEAIFQTELHPRCSCRHQQRRPILYCVYKVVAHNNRLKEFCYDHYNRRKWLHFRAASLP